MYTLEDGGGVEAVHSFDTLKQPKQAKSRPKRPIIFGLGEQPKCIDQKNMKKSEPHE